MFRPVPCLVGNFLTRSRATLGRVKTVRRYAAQKVKISLIKELRQKSNAPLKDCKSALESSSGDMEEAFKWLRERGAAAATKLAGRTSRHGLIGIQCSEDGKSGSIVEVTSETDFVARTEGFQDLVYDITNAALALPLADPPSDLNSNSTSRDIDPADLSEVPISQTSSGIEASNVGEAVTNVVASIRENLQLRRCATMSVQNGVVVGYSHQTVKPGSRLGVKGSLVALESDSQDHEKLSEVGKFLAMHVVAYQPQYLSESVIPPDVLERETAVIRERAIQKNIPEKVKDKFVNGQLRKLFEEIVLLNQKYARDEKGKDSVEKALGKYSKDLGSKIHLVDFRLYNVGEDI